MVARASNHTKRNRMQINVEDVIVEAIHSLAEKEGITVSELCREMMISQLHKMGLLPDVTLRRLAGVRDDMI